MKYDTPIEVSRTGVTGIGLELLDDDTNKPVDLTGVSFTCFVAPGFGAEPIATFPVDVFDPPQGLLEMVFDGAAVPVEGSHEIVQLAYAVKSDAGEVILRGPLYLIPGIAAEVPETAGQ